MNVQPVMLFSLNDDWNLITRTILPVIAQEDIAGTKDNPSGSQSGLGDTVFSAWLSPVEKTKSGWVWGAGPAMLLPTGTNSDNFLGGDQWGQGPSDWRAADCLLKRIDPTRNIARRAKRSQSIDRPIEQNPGQIVVNLVMGEPIDVNDSPFAEEGNSVSNPDSSAFSLG
jgi:hypothetical protein